MGSTLLLCGIEGLTQKECGIPLGALAVCPFRFTRQIIFALGHIRPCIFRPYHHIFGMAQDGKGTIMAKIFSTVLTLAAYTDTAAGFQLRLAMMRPVGAFDPELAALIALVLHF